MAKKAIIVVGSAVEGTLLLVDSNNAAVSLSRYESGKLVFRNSKGVTTEITLTLPGANPSLGQIGFAITAAQSAVADKNWVNADLELVDGSDTFIYPLANAFEIKSRFNG